MVARTPFGREVHRAAPLGKSPVTWLRLVPMMWLVARCSTVPAWTVMAVPLVGAIASAGVLLYRIVDDPDQLVRAALLIALGIVLWFVNHGARRLEGGQLDVGQIDRGRCGHVPV